MRCEGDKFAVVGMGCDGDPDPVTNGEVRVVTGRDATTDLEDVVGEDGADGWGNTNAAVEAGAKLVAETACRSKIFV